MTQPRRKGTRDRQGHKSPGSIPKTKPASTAGRQKQKVVRNRGKGIVRTDRAPKASTRARADTGRVKAPKPKPRKAPLRGKVGSRVRNR